MISTKQRDHTGESFGTELTNRDFVTSAESFGIEGYRPETRADLEDALTSAIGGDTTLIDVPIACARRPVRSTRCTQTIAV